jgi:predicted O-methyltransferase YrrM
MHDWDYVKELAVRRHVDPKPILDEVDAIPDKKKLNSFGPLLYQDYLYALVRIMRPNLVVETGTRYGVGSSMILRALDENETGALYSCDVLFPSQSHAEEGMKETHGFSSFTRFGFLAGKSHDVLPDLATRKGPFDFFVHDSDHGKQNMEWELEFAYANVREGGMIVCDDWDWPDEYDDAKLPHHAFLAFCRRRDLDYHVVGTAGVIEL